MTNILRSSAPKTALVAALAAAVLAGCGPSDGSKELAEGCAAYEVRNLEKAERLFAKSLERAPESVDALLYLARVKLDLGELAAAKKFVTQAATLANDADVRLVAAQVAFHQKDYAASVRDFRSVADDARLDPAVRAQAWSGVGTVEYACENSHLARVAYLRALRLNFKDASARYHLGLLYRDSFGYYAAALEQFQIFARLEADATPRVQRVKLSFIPELQKKINATNASRPGASRRDSAACAKAIARAAAAAKAGKNDTARSEYDAALKSDPLSALAALGLAQCWAKTAPSKKKGGEKKPAEQALKFYQTACELAPSQVKTLLAAGAFAAKEGQPMRAAEFYSRAVAASPTSLEALDGLIRAQRKLGRAKVAQAYQLYRDFLSTSAKRK